MLRYDHSKKILDGIFQSHLQESDGVPIYDAYGELQYRKTSITFPTPGRGISESQNFTVAAQTSYYNILTTTFTTKAFSAPEEGQPFLVEWEGTEYPVNAYLEKDCVYLGNPTLFKGGVPVDLSWSGYDTSLPFVVKISNGMKSVQFNAKGEEAGTYNIAIIQQSETEIYIGLFTKNPDHNGLNFEEPGYDETVEGEIIHHNWPEYLRPRLNTASRFDKNINLLGTAKLNEDGVAEIKNQDMILFPESVGNPDPTLADESTGWGKIVGFGLFYSSNPAEREGDTNIPFLWGDIFDKDGNPGVTLQRFEVPVIRKSSLKFTIE